MAFERRSYRPGGAAAPSAPAPAAPPQRSGDGQFIPVTGLFKSKSGKADTVFVTPEISELLASIKPGDTLGVSTNAKTKRPMVWFIQKDE